MIRLSALFALLALPAFAAPPKVVVDIAPVHALALQVMTGVATPDLLLSQGASPHEATLRPSQARMLADADLVIWEGPELSPWLADALTALSHGDAIALIDAPVTNRRSFTENEAAAMDDGEVGDTDPHVWLSPDNAAAWLPVIAEKLAALDPENAATYRANAATAGSDIAALKAAIDAELAPYQGAKIVTFHDAFGYFARDFGLDIVGSVRPGDASAPSAAAVAALKDVVTKEKIGCAFSEPEFDPALLQSVAGDAGIRIGVLDPIGALQEPGPGNYAATLTAIADAAAACLSAE